MSEAYAFEPETPEEDAAEPETQGRDINWLRQAVRSANLAFDLDDSELAAMGSKVVEEYEIDLASREAAGYDKKLKRAMDLATLTAEAKMTPWPGASNVKFPLIIQAAIQFNARSYPAVVDGPAIVKGVVKGFPTPEKADRADRIGKHMSWQLLEEEKDWEDDTDSLLLRLACLGTLVRMRYFDPVKGRNCSHVLTPDEFVVNYHAKRDLDVCPRATRVLTLYPHEILERQRSGLWLDVDLGDAEGAANDDQAPHTFLEQYRLWDLDDDGYPEPYIVTVHKETMRTVRVKARFYDDEDSIHVNQKGEVYFIKPYGVFAKYGFIPNPDGSFYDIGFGTLLGALNDTIDTTLNQLMDAGALANLQGGFIGDGVSIKSGNQKFKPGEWKRVTSTGPIAQNVLPLQTKEPSAVLFSLMQFLIEAAKDVTATQDILTGDAGKGTMPVGTVQALVEQGLKTFTAIVKRIHRALKRELAIQFELNGRYLNEQTYFTFQDQPVQVIREDYHQGDLDVMPVSDPNMATDMQRMGQAQFVLSLIPTGQVNPTEAVKTALEAAKVQNLNRLLKPPGPPPPDPKAIAAQAKAENDAAQTAIDERLAAAQIEKTEAEAEALQIQNMLAAPQFYQMVEAAVNAAVERTLAMVEHGGQPPVQQQGPVPGMAGPPGNAGLPEPPQGPPGPVGGPMGAGPGNGHPDAMQGPPAGGASYDSLV